MRQHDEIIDAISRSVSTPWPGTGGAHYTHAHRALIGIQVAKALQLPARTQLEVAVRQLCGWQSENPLAPLGLGNSHERDKQLYLKAISVLSALEGKVFRNVPSTGLVLLSEYDLDRIADKMRAGGGAEMVYALATAIKELIDETRREQRHTSDEKIEDDARAASLQERAYLQARGTTYKR